MPVLQSRHMSRMATCEASGQWGEGGSEHESSPNRLSTAEDSSFTISSNERLSPAGNTAVLFLHSRCQLQKDSGKGLDPGTRITSRGRESAMVKLVEKMDVLAEVEQDGTFANAELARVKAKDTGIVRVNAGLTLVETRSMLAVKVGFLSLRYGILVHWNTATGLAELIVLRKKCPDSFMKAKQHNTKKAWRKRMRRKSLSADLPMEDFIGAPSHVTLTSAEESDASCCSFGLEAVKSYPY